MFDRTAAYYDAIYDHKDYAAEAERIATILRGHGRPKGRLLDVACGTGRHLKELQVHYEVEGLDLDEALLEVARQRLPRVPLHVGDMRSLALEGRYQIITCLFSSIGYVEDLQQLATTLRGFHDHLVPGGIAMVEPWFTPGQFGGGRLDLHTIDGDDLKVCRVSRTRIEGRRSEIEFHYLLATREDVQTPREKHQLLLITEAEMTTAFQGAGFEVEHDPEGLTGRGLYLAQRPQE